MSYYVPALDFRPGSGVDPELLCPRCGPGGYLHHCAVTVYGRREDATQGLRVRVVQETASIDTAMEGNPSLRRDGLSIDFFCEICDVRLVLELSQHKGQTYLWWREVSSHDPAE